MSIASINPTTGKLIKSYSPLASKELGHKLEKAWNTFHEYRHTSIADRGFLMRRAAELLDEEKESFGRLMTAEMGKTFRAAIEECQKSAWACRYFCRERRLLARR